MLACESDDGAVEYDEIARHQSYRFRDDGRLDALDATERIATRQTGPIPGFRSETNVRMQLRDAESATAHLAGWLDAARRARGGTRESADSRRATEKILDQARIAGHEYSTALADLAAYELGDDPAALGDDAKERAGRAYIALTALLRSSPKLLDEVRNHILSEGHLAATLISALRDSGTPQAQSLLAHLVRRTDLELEVRMDAARALSHVGRPTDETVATLRALRTDDPLGVQARYGLGSNAYRLRDDNPKLAAALARDLHDELASASGVREKRELLIAMGNAGHTSSIPVVQSSMRDSSPEIRAASAQALRRIPGETVDELLSELARDPDPRVRTSAMDAIGERTPSHRLVQRVIESMLGDPVFEPRARAVRAAIHWVGGVPMLVEPLRRVAASEANEHLRRAAEAALLRVDHSG